MTSRSSWDHSRSATPRLELPSPGASAGVAAWPVDAGCGLPSSWALTMSWRLGATAGSDVNRVIRAGTCSISVAGASLVRTRSTT